MTIPLLTTRIDLFVPPDPFPGAPAASHEVSIALAPNATQGQPWSIVFTAGGKSETYALDRGAATDPNDPNKLVDGEVYTFALAPGHGIADLLGLDLAHGGAATLAEVRIEVRPQAGDEGWSKEAPFAAVLFCWDLNAATSDTIRLPDAGEVAAGVAVAVRACAGLAAIAPPDGAAGISNFAVRVDLESLGVSTGWRLLTGLSVPPLSDFHMPALLDWMARMAEWEIPPLPYVTITPIDWDVDFPIRLDLPLRLSVDEARFRMLVLDGGVRITASLRGLNALIGSFPINYGDFRAELVWADSAYSFFAQFADLRYPDDGQTGRFRFGLPFDLLAVSAHCWRLRVGLFASNSTGKWRFCFDTLMEIGDLRVFSGPAGEDDPLYRANARIHLRDLQVLTAAAPAGLRLFGDIAGDPFSTYHDVEVPALTFAGQEKDKTAPKNEYGLEFLDGSYRTGERLHLAWRQRGGQLLKALSADLLGTEPAGALPDDAAWLWMALEVAWFDGPGGSDTQVRLDWSDRAPVPVSGAPGAPGTVLEGDICVTPADGALFLPPVENPPDVSTISTGDDAFDLALPGVAVSVRRPDSHSLVFRREGDGRESLAWLGSYGPGRDLSFAGRSALVSAALDFSMAPAAGGRRQVQPTSRDARPFLELRLGHRETNVQRAVQIAAWRTGERLRFLQTYRTTAPPVTRILAGAKSPLGLDDCPGPAPAPVPAVALPVDAFRGFALRDPGQWELALGSKLLDSFLNLFGDDDAGRSVSVRIAEVCVPETDAEDDRSLIIRTTVGVNMPSGLVPGKVSGTVNFRLNIEDFALSIEDGAELGLELDVEGAGLPHWARDLKGPDKTTRYWHSKEFRLLGLEMRGIVATDPGASGKIKVLTLTMQDGRFAMGLPKGVDLLIHYPDLGDGLVFRAEEFMLGSGGLDLTAGLLATKLKLPGLQKPFALESARLVVAGGRIQDVVISGSGQLPALLNDAPVEIAVHLADRGGRLKLVDFECALGDGDSPIFSRGVRCRFQITKLTIDYDDRGGTRPPAWFFRITGSLAFVPQGSEFAGKLLEAFDKIELAITDAPLGDEFFEHIELIATLVKPEKFPVLNLFEMEVRSIGFHPRYGPFDTPAIIIGGQIAFAELGDIPAVQVDFHRLYLGMPKPGEILPQMEAKGLRVEIATTGFRIAGRVEHRDDELVDGFFGEGTILIPGLPELSAAFGFAKLRAVETDGWKHGWFIAIEASRISYPIGPLPLYLRQIGLGFGYRFTSVLIAKFENERELGPLIRLMLEEINRHQTLARIESWAPDAERDGQRSRWSIGLEGVFSMASANSTPLRYEPEAEKKLKTLVAQMLVFVRSDFTFMAAAKLWYPVSTHDFFVNQDGMRQRPLALGFMAYSAPKNRLLIHAAKGKNPYLGPPNDPVPDVVKKILDNSHFEATLLSEPGLLHAELGWPDRLFFKFSIGGLELECRGGVLFRLERDLLIQGIYYSARAQVSFGGGVSLGIVGAEISATARFTMGVRMLMSVALSRPLQSKIYAAIGVDIAVQFSVYVWFRLNLRFCKISIDIRFSLNLQIVVALEIGWAGGTDLGFRAQAKVMIGAFGRGLAISVRASLAADNVARARAALEPYMRSFLEPGAIPPIPGLGADRLRTPGPFGDGRVEDAVVLDDLPPGIGPVASALDAPPPGAAAPRREDGFVLTVTRGRTDAQGRRLWFGWVMPNPVQDHAYPVNREMAASRESGVSYANLVYPATADTQVYVPTIAMVDGVRTLVWSADEDAPGRPDHRLAALTIDLEFETKFEFQDNGQVLPVGFANLLAGCYAPAAVGNLPDNALEAFPGTWHEHIGLADVAPPRGGEATVDDRLLDPDSPALSPRRQLDPDHPYDAALQRVMAGGADAGAARNQALGNQSFLFQSFMDDLDRLAREVGFDGNAPAAVALPRQGRPDLADLGLFVCVVAQNCPDWLYHRPEPEERAQWPAATLDFSQHHAGADGDELFGGSVLPVVDFRAADFSISRPLVRQTATWFDDETLNFGWTIEWGGDRPNSVFSETAGKGVAEIGMFLTGYEVVVEMEGREDPIERTLVLPADLIAPGSPGSDGPTRVAPRYQYSRQLRDLPLDSRAALSAAQRVTATIRPLGQDGTRGERFSMTAVYRRSAAPLAADDATLTLRMVDRARLEGDLEWRILVPPNDPGVAPAGRWELILRPLSRLPLGAWPSEASDPDDGGLASTGGTGLRDGDIVLPLRATVIGDAPEDDGLLDALEESAERPPALRRVRVRFGPEGAASLEHFADGVYDFEGRRQSPDSPGNLIALARGFLDRQPATAPDGAGWYLFLRAASRPLPTGDDPLPADGYSAIVPATLLLASDAAAHRDRRAPLQSRTLEHLEWPEAEHPAWPAQTLPWHQVPQDAISAVQGNLHVAAIGGRMAYEDAKDGADDTLYLGFLPLPGRDRGVTIRWGAIWDGADAPRLEQIAAYHLYETNMDALVNFDRSDADRGAFEPDWLRLREIRPTDRAYAARAVTSFVQPEIWDAVTPADAATMAWLSDARIPQDQMSEQAPGWYSWAESELEWPDPQDLAARGLALLAAGLNDDLARDANGLGKSREVHARALAALHELGRHAARRRLHPWVSVVLGQLVMRGAARVDGTADPEVRFVVEVSPGKPALPNDADAAPPDPVGWMEGDVEELDPLGWGALWHLGLAATLSLRNPVTGLYLLQEKVRTELAAAIGDLRRAAEGVPEEADAEPEAVTLALLLELKELPRHLAIDLPLQTQRAQRTQPGEAGMSDTAALSLVQIALRPVPVALARAADLRNDAPPDLGPGAVRYGVLQRLPGAAAVQDDVTVTPPFDLFAILPGDEAGTIRLVAGQPAALRRVLPGPRGFVLLRWQQPGTGGAPAPELPDPASWLLAQPGLPADQLRAIDGLGEVPLPLNGVYGDGDQNGDDADIPAALTAHAADGEAVVIAPSVTPFARFPIPEGGWKDFVFPFPVPTTDPQTPWDTSRRDRTQPAPRIATFVTWLVRAFVRVTGDAPDANAEQVKEAQAAAEKNLREGVLRRESFAETYRVWGRRFFRAAPLPTPTDSTTVFAPHRLTAAMPKRTEPARMAPDAQGMFTYTHRVAEDWASLRGYSVRAMGRYRELQVPGEIPPLPDFNSATGRPDVEIPRRRRIAAPKLLGVRALEDVQRTPTGNQRRRVYYEVTISDHVEQALSRANSMLARKLEFQFLQRRFVLDFAYPEWIAQLDGLDIFDAHGPPRHGPAGPDGIDWKVVRDGPTPGLGAGDYQAAVPMARFGAHRLLTPAEPDYYRQRQQVRAKAVHVESHVLTIDLPRQPARAPAPWQDEGAGPPFTNSGAPQWTSYPDAAATVLADAARAIAARIDGGAHAALIVPYLAPSGRRLRVRFPRLVELLDPWSLTAHFSAEAAPASYGRLPDPEARVEIAIEDSFNRQTVAIVEPDPEAGPTEPTPGDADLMSPLTPFRVRQVTTAMAVRQIHEDEDLQNWPAGLHVTADAVLAPAPAATPVTALPDVPLIDLTAEPPALPPALLDWLEGPLQQLAPLMLRLTLGRPVDATVPLQEHNPLAGPRWLFRPHLEPAPAAAASEVDHALALRLYLDPFRRGAAREVQPRRDLLRIVEEAAFVLPVETAGQQDFTALVGLVETGAADNPNSLWRRRGDWARVGAPADIAEGDRVMVVLAAGSADILTAFRAVFPASAAEYGLPADRAALAATLARLAWRPAGQPTLVAHAHHGNVPPAPWGLPAEDGGGDDGRT